MRRRMDRFIDAIEWVAAIFVGIVAVDIFLSVLLRYFFSTSIPDSYNFGQLLLGILIFWGIAATSYLVATRNDNILTVDLHLPTWPFFAIAWAGDVSAVLLIAIRTWRLIFHPEDLHAGGPQAKAVE